MRNFEIQNDLFIRPSDYVDAKALAGVAKVFVVPALAQYARLSTNADLYYIYGSSVVTVPTDVSDGTAPTIMTTNGVGERFFKVTPGDKIGVNTASTAVTGEATMEYWRA